MNPTPMTAIIIPTTCELRRWNALNRAIESLKRQSTPSVRIILVVNGTRFDREKFNELKTRTDIEVVYNETGSVTLAQKTGRELVAEKYFGFLDDDDEYLVDGLKQKLLVLEADQSIDFVASNGFRHLNGRDDIVISSPARVSDNPLGALSKANWLASCAGLFRSSSVPTAFFDPEIKYYEWTYLAYRLLTSQKKLVFLDQPCYRINNTEESLSKRVEFDESFMQVLGKIEALPLPESVRRDISRQKMEALHSLADRYLVESRLREAWRAHLASVSNRQGWKYLFFTRRLLGRSLSRILR